MNRKKSYVCYVYGQIYAEYLLSGKKQFFLIENIDARCWKNILNWLKRKNCIEDYAMGESIENACKLVINGFNENNKIYRKYLEGIDKNLKIA